MSACKYYDCGWCYAPDYLKTNAVQGGCFDPEHCPSQMSDLKFTSPSGETTIKVQDTGRLGTVAPKTQLHIKMDEPVQYETPMTDKELIEIEIAYFQEQIKVKQKKLKELEQTKSPVEEAYNEWYGEYPTNTWQGDVNRWDAFQAGYNAAYEEKVSEEPIKNKMPLYYRFREFGYLIPDSESFCKILKDFLMDEGVIEDEDDERITFTLQKYLLDTPNA
mgnify:CR=1 FL=1